MGKILHWLGDNTSGRRFNILLLAAYAVMLGAGLAHHEMWRDEMQVWMTGNCSRTFSGFWANTQYEPGPLLWYFCLFLVAQISTHPAALQVFQFIVAFSTAYLFVRFAPFVRLQKIFFVFGYFMLYEYGVFARGYVSGMFLLFLFAVLFSSRQRNYIALCLVLFLLANTSTFGIIVACSLLLMMTFHHFNGKGTDTRQPAGHTKFIFSMTALAAGIAWVYISSIPPADSIYSYSWFEDWDPGRLYNAVYWFSASFFPVPDIFTMHFWNTNLVLSFNIFPSYLFFIVYGISIILLSAVLFYRKPGILLFVLTATAGFMLFFLFNRSLHLRFAARHYGHIFLVFTTAYWVAPYYRNTLKHIPTWHSGISKGDAAARITSWALTGLFAIQTVGGICAWTMDFIYPFSGAEKAAQIIRGKKLSHLPVAGSEDYSVSPVSGFLQKPVYYPESGTCGTFMKWNFFRTRSDSSQIAGKLRNFILSQDSPVVLVLNYTSNLSDTEIRISAVDSTGPSVVADESYYIYLAGRRNK